MTHILLIEDEPLISAFVAKGLKAAGFGCSVEATGESGLYVARTSVVDLIVLDVGLPDISGFDLLERLRGEGVTIPVIILTARSSAQDTVAGLVSGADDYMSKPFSFDELLARIRLRLRGARADTPSTLSHGDITLNLLTRRVTIDGREDDLSAREFALLETFLRHPDQVLSREQLLSTVWGFDFDPGSNIVDVYVRYLRRKIGADRLKTVRNMGYRLVGLS
ncbi:MAG: response regulator transcription factor [Propionibacteriaceae bacterium]|nr:response regulator transcription factor [Propionibacteriaceae bacterium]